MAASKLPRAKGKRRASARTQVPAPAASQKGGGDVHADHLDAQPSQHVGVATRPTADVEDPHAGSQVEHVHQEGHLVLGAAGERVPQVGLAGVARNGFELPPG